jgi:hypothetical protein
VVINCNVAGDGLPVINIGHMVHMWDDDLGAWRVDAFASACFFLFPAFV